MGFSPETIPADRPPILIGAGFNRFQPLALALSYEETVAAQTLGAFSEPAWSGNGQGGRLNVVHWDAQTGAFYNSVGLENPGRMAASEYLPETIRKIRGAGQLAIVSVVALKHEDPLQVLPGLVEWGLEMGADVVEIDGSCANQDPDASVMCTDVETTLEMIDAVRTRVGYDPTLAFKVSDLSAETIELYKDSQYMNVDIITAINSVGNQKVPINKATGQPYIEVNGGYAGMSGPIIKNIARSNLANWLDGPFHVFSLGGVDGGREIALRQSAGALLVGGVQAFCRARDPRRVAQDWAGEYLDYAM
jgi:dihydroorotate dehydrogenase